MMTVLVALLLLGAPESAPEAARDAQDRPALQQIVAELTAAAQKYPSDAAAQYRLAVAQSYSAEVALELRDKNAAKDAAVAGIRAAEKAVALDPARAEHHRIHGTLCGQVIPANTWLGLKYGQCALEAIDRAIRLDPKSAIAHVSRGVGNYYLPQQLGGGMEKATQDFRRAIEFDPKLSEAHLWMGLALRKLNRNAEARTELQKALRLNPRRIWIKQQLEKTPVQ